MDNIYFWTHGEYFMGENNLEEFSKTTVVNLGMLIVLFNRD